MNVKEESLLSGTTFYETEERQADKQQQHWTWTIYILHGLP